MTINEKLSLNAGLFSLLLSFIIISCAPPSIHTTVLKPALFDEAAKLKTVAVLPFEGTEGRPFASEVESVLASINIGDKQYFTVVERTKLDGVLHELHKSNADEHFDEGMAARIGKMVGAKGIYTGAIITSRTDDSQYKEQRSECTSYEQKTDKKGNTYQGRCLNTRTYDVSCTKRVASFGFVPKLIEVETGRIIYSKDISKSANDSRCSDSSTPLATQYDLLSTLKESGLDIFKRDIAPHYVTVEIKLMDSTDGLNSSNAKSKFEQALEFAKNNRIDRACELWGEARAQETHSPSILYNLGICSEVVGELEQALGLYRDADRLLLKPDDRVSAALYRVQEAIGGRQKLKEQINKEDIRKPDTKRF
jgi:tetratricopeptide (TPR) repeat protein